MPDRRWVPTVLPLLAAILLAVIPPYPLPLAGQGAPPETGAVRAGLLLRQMDGVKRVLVIGAHPDDEDTALLAALARGWGARAAYLSLTRGEGGQNLIGPELGEALGLVRTGELLAARRLDGAEQYFTRAYDFGYSKSAAEAFEHWPRDSLLADVVWVVRSFRPQVIVSVFSGTETDGHGQHQVAGILARESFDAAGDPARFPEQLSRGVEPWTPVKLYRRTLFDPEASTLTFPTGELDPLLGRSHFQVAMESRSQHRSQDFGAAQPGGPHASHLRLLERRTAGPDTSLFAGVDTALASLARGLPAGHEARLARALEEYRAETRAAREALSALAPAEALPPLARALAAVRRGLAAAESAGGAGGRAVSALREREALAGEVLLAAARVTLTVRADDDLVVPGQGLTVAAELWNGGPASIRARRVGLEAPAGWSVEPTTLPPEPRWPFAALGLDDPEAEAGVEDPEPPGIGPEGRRVAPGALERFGLAVGVPVDASPSRPYFLREERAGDLYRWPEEPELWALPRSPPPLRGFAELELEVEGETLELRIERPARHRGVDKALGEFWRPLLVAPALSVALEPSVLVWPAGSATVRRVSVSVRSNAQHPLEGMVRLERPDGWVAEPVARGFVLESEGASSSLPFYIQAGAPEAVDSGEHEIRATAHLEDGRSYGRVVRLVDYPHIDPWLHGGEAAGTLRAFPVRVAGDRRIGYVMGSGDDVPEAIRQLGLEVELLEPSRVAEGDFDGFDVVVLGIRAYETRPELGRANERLLEWVRGGGTLIVQYNKYEYVEGGFAPYAVSIGRPHDRVTVEEAPVTILAPEAPAFRAPNRIGAADFQGWVQERGLYLLGEWEPPFVPLLEMADPGEEPKRGSLVVAPVGEGIYLYTGLAFFRQLPAGVPGAYRLFANLLSATPAEWRSWLEGRGSGGGS